MRAEPVPWRADRADGKAPVVLLVTYGAQWLYNMACAVFFRSNSEI